MRFVISYLFFLMMAEPVFTKDMLENIKLDMQTMDSAFYSIVKIINTACYKCIVYIASPSYKKYLDNMTKRYGKKYLKNKLRSFAKQILSFRMGSKYVNADGTISIYFIIRKRNRRRIRAFFRLKPFAGGYKLKDFRIRIVNKKTKKVEWQSAI